jgi:hypothetical protein
MRDNPKITPTKPTTKPSTKPGRVSPIPRKEPSVKPAPKASYLNMSDVENERIKNLLIEQHGHMYEEKTKDFYALPKKHKIRPFSENMSIVMDIWFPFLKKNNIEDTSLELFAKTLQGLFVDKKGEIIEIDFFEQSIVNLYNSKKPYGKNENI